MSDNFLFPAKLLSLLQTITQLRNYNQLVTDTLDMALNMPVDSNKRLSLSMAAVQKSAQQDYGMENVRVRLIIPARLDVTTVMNSPLIEVYNIANNGQTVTQYNYKQLSPQLALAVEVEMFSIVAKGLGAKLVTS